MSDLNQDIKARNKQIADNEEQRQRTSSLRVSGFAIAIVGVIVLLGVWFWMTR
jgi:tetrahydromethanopterin S-methyltransferase subunit F